MSDLQPQLFQNFLPGLDDLNGLAAAVNTMREADIEERGAVYTRSAVVDFILDLSGYDPKAKLEARRLLEPSFGSGNFLLPAIRRLLDSFKLYGGSMSDTARLRDCIRTVELHTISFKKTAHDVRSLLLDYGIPPDDVEDLMDAWMINDDFLLVDLPGEFDHVVGNPPYVRQEKIPDILMGEYRTRFSTIFDRADLYVPFIERSLRLLASEGTCAFICSDRWMKNRYGAPLRKLVSQHYRLKAFVDMVNTQAFESDVIAYPAIAVISREKPGPVRVAIRPAIEPDTLFELAVNLRNETSSHPHISEIDDVVQGGAPWIFEGAEKLALVRRLEKQFPTLEEAGCRVGIGVATGADKVYLTPHDTLDIEPDRKLPLVMTRDILSGEVKWNGLSLVNPFDDAGRLVDLKHYPKLAAYFERHGNVVRTRHVAKKKRNGWYRTIDKVVPPLARQPKLLIPDIKGSASIVYEKGKYYPHHNLYFIVSDSWNLHALQNVLTSGIAHLFVSAYSTRMRGGYLRFQAQYLRRICVPHWETVSPEIKAELSRPAIPPHIAKNLVQKLYELTSDEVAVLQENQPDVLKSLPIREKSA